MGSTRPRAKTLNFVNRVSKEKCKFLSRPAGPGPEAGYDVWLLDGAAAALHELATCELWAGTRVAVASSLSAKRALSSRRFDS